MKYLMLSLLLLGYSRKTFEISCDYTKTVYEKDFYTCQLPEGTYCHISPIDGDVLICTFRQHKEK